MAHGNISRKGQDRDSDGAIGVRGLPAVSPPSLGSDQNRSVAACGFWVNGAKAFILASFFTGSSGWLAWPVLQLKRRFGP